MKENHYNVHKETVKLLMNARYGKPVKSKRSIRKEKIQEWLLVAYLVIFWAVAIRFVIWMMEGVL